MSEITRSNDDLLLELEGQTTELEGIKTDTATIASATTSIDGKVSTEAKQDDIITAIGSIAVGSNKGNTGTESSVAQSATSVTLLAANAGRKEAYIRNDASSKLYISLTGTATLNVPIVLKKDDVFSDETYTGEITGIWASGTGGFARVTEITEV